MDFETVSLHSGDTSETSECVDLVLVSVVLSVVVVSVMVSVVVVVSVVRVVFTLILTAVGRVGSGAVEEAG